MTGWFARTGAVAAGFDSGQLRWLLNGGMYSTYLKVTMAVPSLKPLLSSRISI